MTGSGKIALVTGANKGIGFQTAKQLAQADVTTIIGSRSPQRGTGAVHDLSGQGLELTSIQLDTADPTSIESAAAAITEGYGRLDILVNNAGMADFVSDGPPTRASLQAIREALEANFIGTVAVTQAMLPLLQRSSGARIVNLSSALGSIAVNGDPTSPFYDARLIGYNASKAAVNMLTVQLNAELRDSTIAVVSVSPGYVKTDLTGGQGSMTPEEGAVTPVRYALSDDGDESGRHFGPDGEIPW